MKYMIKFMHALFPFQVHYFAFLSFFLYTFHLSELVKHWLKRKEKKRPNTDLPGTISFTFNVTLRFIYHT